MYKKRSNGSYRMRASIPVTTEQVEGLNVICRRTDLSFAQVCAKALDKALQDYIREGGFNYPDKTPLITDSAPQTPLNSL
jgi:hypothetical protein